MVGDQKGVCVVYDIRKIAGQQVLKCVGAYVIRE